MKKSLIFLCFLLSHLALSAQVDSLIVRAGYYDGNLWHRIISDFMIQTGDSTTHGAVKFPPEMCDYYWSHGGTPWLRMAMAGR